MDALELVDLARLGSVSSGLRDVLQAPIPQLAMEHCRAASDRANLLEAHLQDLRGIMMEVGAARDAAEEERDELALELEDAEAAREAAVDAQALAEDHRDAAEQARDAAEQELDAARGRIRELELELADAKRARR